MPQSPLLIGTLNSIRALPAASLPLDGTFLVEVQDPSPVAGVDKPRQKVPVNSLVGGQSAIAGNIQPAGFFQEGYATGLTAVGTNRATALALTEQVNRVTVAASANTGVLLPSAALVGVGGYVDVINDGPSNSFHVYSAGSDTIDGVAGATGVVLTNAFMCRYVVNTAGAFVSYRQAVTRSA